MVTEEGASLGTHLCQRPGPNGSPCRVLWSFLSQSIHPTNKHSAATLNVHVCGCSRTCNWTNFDFLTFLRFYSEIVDFTHRRGVAGLEGVVNSGQNHWCARLAWPCTANTDFRLLVCVCLCVWARAFRSTNMDPCVDLRIRSHSAKRWSNPIVVHINTSRWRKFVHTSHRTGHELD